MAMTTTVTSTVATFAAVTGPVYIPYTGFMLLPGLSSARPMRPAVVSQSIESSGSLLGAWSGSVTRHAEFGNFEAVWGIRPLAVASGPSLIGFKSLVDRPIEL